MRIGVTGASGMLGTAILRKLSLDKSNKLLATSRSKGLTGNHIRWNCFDLKDRSKLKDWLNINQPDIIVHCAAMVNVDMCEDYPVEAKKLHVYSTDVISEFMDKKDRKLIYISTDSVYDGHGISPHQETDNPSPGNYYSKTKLFGEASVNQMKNGIILRTNILGWSSTSHQSFFEWILNNLNQKNTINLFTDVLFSPIHVSQLSDIVDIFLSKSVGGIFNCGSRDYLSKYQFGIKVAEIFNFPKYKILASTLEDVELKAARPKNMALCTNKLENTIEYKVPTTDEVINLLYLEYKNSAKPQTV